MKRFLLILSAFLLFQVSAWAQHTVSGVITDSRTGETLIGATVYDTLSKRGTATNQQGRYTLTLKGDRAVLRISFVGCETQYHPLQLDRDYRLNWKLQTSTTLQEVKVTGQRVQHVESSQTSVVELPVEQVKALPMIFGETDVVKAVQLLPGVQSGSEGTSGMYVRGGGPDENLFLLDGVPMYNVNHLGGFFSAFNSDAVKNIQLYKGSFPAHFGSRLSSVLDITTNNGNDKELHGGASLGLISAKFYLEGPIVKERTTFSVSGRRTYGDVLLQPLIALVVASEGANAKVNAGYYFYDLNAKVTHRFNDRSRLYASYYMGDDVVYIGLKTGYRYSGGEESVKFGWNWGNIVSSLRWNYEITPKLFMNLTGSYTRYRNRLAMTLSERLTSYEQNFDFDFTETLKSGIEDWTGRLDFDYNPTPDHSVKFGGQYLYHLFTPETGTEQIRSTDADSTFNYSHSSGQSLIHAGEITGYVEDDWRIADWLKVNMGLNATTFFVQHVAYPSLQPRVSGRVLLNDRLSLKAGYAYMTQYLHLLSNSNLSLPSDLWVPVTARIKPMTSQQVAAGVFYNLLDSINLSVEGYYKYMNNLLEYKDGASFWGNSQGWEDKVCMGRGWSYGVEFLAQKSVGRLTGWVGYTWSHANRLFDREGQMLNGGKVFPAKYDRRHDVSIVMSYKFDDRMDASATWVFSTGNAGTLALQEFDPEETGSQQYYDYWDYYYNDNLVPYVSSRNNYRMPNYHRMDISINFHKNLRYGKRTINISIYNLYNRQNPYLVYKSYGGLLDYGSSKTLRQVSLFPMIPSVSYTWQF